MNDFLKGMAMIVMMIFTSFLITAMFKLGDIVEALKFIGRNCQ